MKRNNSSCCVDNTCRLRIRFLRVFSSCEKWWQEVLTISIRFVLIPYTLVILAKQNIVFSRVPVCLYVSAQ